MLSPEYIDSIGGELLGLYDALEISITEDIARRIVKTGKVTSTAEWQALQLQYSGMIMDDVIEKVAAATPYSEAEIKQLFNDAGTEAIRSEATYVKAAGEKTIAIADSGAMKRILDVNIQSMVSEIRNLTGTTAVQSQMSYIRATDLAYMQVSSGAFSYNEAITRAIKSAAQEGLKISYPSGRVANLDVAVRRSVLTSINQTAGKLTEQYAEESGCNYYEVTAHAGARPSHQIWQGQVYQIKGSSKEYKNFYSATNYGAGDGLCGWNCRHSFHLYWPGLSKRAYSDAKIKSYNEQTCSYNGQKMTYYEATQECRKQERSIRETKRVLAAQNAAIKATTDESLLESLNEQYKAESKRLKQKERALKDFTKQTGTKYDSARMQVKATYDAKGNIVGFDRSASSRAVAASKKK